MGVAGAIIGTLAMGYFNGKAQQQQYDAMAAQAEANSRIAEANAKKADDAAKLQDQNNKINEENQRRKALLHLGSQRASIGASGITATGSALGAMQDSLTQIDTDSAISANNNRQKVQQLFEQSTEHSQYAASYKSQANNYRAAGNSAFTNSMLGAVFSAITPLSGGLYSSKSSAIAGSGSGYNPSYSDLARMNRG